MSNPRGDYLSVEDQALITSQVRRILLDSPREAMLVDKGPLFAAGAVLASGVVFWRSAFRGYRLARYGRRRLVTLCMPIMASINGGLSHEVFVRDELFNMFRDENHLAYGLRSAFAHQPGLLGSFIMVTCFTFWQAHEIGILPTPKRIFVKGARQEAFNVYLSKLKPYRKPMALTWAISTAFMFAIGLLEYKQSRALLAKLDRKTLGLREG